MSLPLSRISELLTTTNRLPTRRTYSTKKKPEQDPADIPSFSFNGLGASLAVKAVVYLSIGVIATAETYTYGIWIWGWWNNRGKGEERMKDSEKEL